MLSINVLNDPRHPVQKGLGGVVAFPVLKCPVPSLVDDLIQPVGSVRYAPGSQSDFLCIKSVDFLKGWLVALSNRPE
mgnify:CR=1 FL=1